MIYEHRVYEIMPGKMPAIHERFANVTMRLFEKHGMKVVGFWQTAVGDNSQLVYILAFDDLNHMERAWREFTQDEEWQRAKRESEKEGPLVARVRNTVLRPTPYSPLQ